MLSSGDAQEAHDMAIITQISSSVLKKPFIHFFEAPYGESKVKENFHRGLRIRRSKLFPPNKSRALPPLLLKGKALKMWPP
jgi:hypothetical protein